MQILLICQCRIAVKMVGYLIQRHEAGQFHTCTCNRITSHSDGWKSKALCKETYISINSVKQARHNLQIDNVVVRHNPNFRFNSDMIQKIIMIRTGKSDR